MYLNVFLVEDLALELKEKLQGHRLIDAFTTHKHEIFLLFDNPLGLRVQFYQGIAYFQVVEFKHIQKKNRFAIFEEIEDHTVVDVIPFALDRVFEICFDHGKNLVFYLFGKFSQISAYDQEDLLEKFPARTKRIDPKQESDPNRSNISGWSMQELHQYVPFLKDADLKLLENSGFGSGRNSAAWNEMKYRHYDYCRARVEESDTSVHLLPSTLDGSSSLLSILSEFSMKQISRLSFEKKKKERLAVLEHEFNVLRDRERKLKQGIAQVNASIGFKKKADLIMANLHQIEYGMEQVELPDFTSEKMIRIKLKKDLSPQANAEKLYSKAKNESKRLQYLEQGLEGVMRDMQQNRKELAQVTQASDHKALKQKIEEKTGPSKRVPYKKYTIEGFEVRVGKSASDNDELLRSHSSKQDIWLHARSVSGSHVIIRVNKNQTVPQSVLAQAAGLAAKHSKSQHEELAAVIYTERRYVRKPRKALPGQVLVEREKLLMVEPLDL